ncbi:MAG: hypothetical protein NTV97_30670 [Alphaproteobacteria bacterium]|nr:hypothetical protein [Alphaproteobacteria bacterium]
MLDILKERHFSEHYANGFLETDISLPGALVDEIQHHYAAKAIGHNDFPKFFVRNEHLASVESKALGMFFSTFPSVGTKMVKKLYDRAYEKAVYCDQTFVEKVLKQLMESGFQRLFQTRYIVAGYDMYLRNNHRSPGAGIHSDLPNFHHFYETENDLSLYIPLVDFDEGNGGRLSVLPESKLKMPGNVLLKLLYDYFSKIPESLDADGYVDPAKVGGAALAAFIKSRPHQELLALYRGVIGLVKTQYAGEFRKTVETRGKVLMFNNKNFHAAEDWKNEQVAREVYVIRMFPVYDAHIKLKREIHGTLANNFLLDMKLGEVRRFEDAVDLGRLPDEEKLKL